MKTISKQASREKYLFNRVANTWNSLPSELVEASTVNSFKSNYITSSIVGDITKNHRGEGYRMPRPFPPCH